MDSGEQISMSRSDGNLVHYTVALNNQRDLLASPETTPESTPRPERQSKPRTRRKKSGKKDKGKRKAARRSRSVTQRKRRDSLNLAIHVPDTSPCDARDVPAATARGDYARTAAARSELAQPAPKKRTFLRSLKMRFGGSRAREIIEGAGARALAASSSARAPFIIDEQGHKRGLLPITGSRRYFLVVDRVGSHDPASAQGAHGAVFKGWDSVRECYVAIKRQGMLRTPLPPSFDDARSVDRHRMLEKHMRNTADSLRPFREVEIMRYVSECKLKSRGADNDHALILQHGKQALLPLVDTFFSPTTDTHYIITPYSELGDLFYLFENKAALVAQADTSYENILRELFCDMVCAVHYLHTIGVCHGDVKLENFILFWDPQRGRFCARITDFGLSQFGYARDMSARVSLTPLYASPELIHTAVEEARYRARVSEARQGIATPFACGSVGKRIELTNEMMETPKAVYQAGGPDVWALGVSLYCLVCECHPFMPPDELVEDVRHEAEFARLIRHQQSRYFERARRPHKPIPEINDPDGAFAIIDAIFNRLWPVRPNTLEIVQTFPWVRTVFTGERKRARDAVSMIPVECSPEELTPFARSMKAGGCGTKVALQFNQIEYVKDGRVEPYQPLE